MHVAQIDPASERFETATGRWAAGPWRYTSYRPRELAGLVDHLWAYSGPTVHAGKRVFPNGCVELLINFAEPYRVLAREGRAALPTAWVSGTLTRAVIIEQPAWQRCIAARLRPAGARALLATPLHALAERSVDLGDLVGPAAARELVARCADLGSHQDQLRALAAWLRARIERARGGGGDGAVAWAAREIDASDGGASIRSLSEATRVSPVRLRELFRDQVGVAPKLYARIVRFRRALALLQAGTARLSEVALAANYYDQPHMNAEFRALGGVTPTAFLAARHPVGDGSTAAAAG